MKSERDQRVEPFAYVAQWTRKRSTVRLKMSLQATERLECECDSYVAFECSKHRRLEELRWAISVRCKVVSERPCMDGTNP